jgi:Arc/MetJ-type ribon-helix-helix transcriptional regulator
MPANNTKSLNIRFTVAHIKAMDDLVNAGLYTSIADIVRASVRDLLIKEYFNREAEVEKLILKKGSREETYGQGDRAKGFKQKKRIDDIKEKAAKILADLPDLDDGPLGVGGSSELEPTPTIFEDDSQGSQEEGS